MKFITLDRNPFSKRMVNVDAISMVREHPEDKSLVVVNVNGTGVSIKRSHKFVMRRINQGWIRRDIEKIVYFAKEEYKNLTRNS